MVPAERRPSQCLQHWARVAGAGSVHWRTRQSAPAVRRTRGEKVKRDKNKRAYTCTIFANRSSLLKETAGRDRGKGEEEGAGSTHRTWCHAAKPAAPKPEAHSIFYTFGLPFARPLAPLVS